MYLKERDQRLRQKKPIPADLTKQEVLDAFKAELEARDLLHAVKLLVVVQEKHKRWNRTTQQRELHVHVAVQLKAPFAHEKLRLGLARRGLKGMFTFNLVGMPAYLRYLLEPSAGKLGSDLDPDPASWPHRTREQLLQVVAAETPANAVRNAAKQAGTLAEPSTQSAAKQRGRKRILVTFSEFTDAVIEGKVHSEEELWALARRRKEAGDDTLWNYLGSLKDVQGQLRKALSGWNHEGMSRSSSLQRTVPFSLERFHVPPLVQEWMDGLYTKKVLILSGVPGFGKTELACAAGLAVSAVKAYHFLNTQDDVKDVVFGAGESLVVDETCFSHLHVDDVKAWLDLEKPRRVRCRNKNGFLPAGLPRVFSCNHPWVDFFPAAGNQAPHKEALTRRCVWVEVNTDLRRLQPGPAALPQSAPSAASSASPPALDVAASIQALLAANPAALQQLLASLTAAAALPVLPLAASSGLESGGPSEDDEDVFYHGGVTVACFVY